VIIVPAWRRYRILVLADGDICIVDPPNERGLSKTAGPAARWLRRHRRRVGAMSPLALALALAHGVLGATPASTETIIGRASVIDGDTIEIRGQRIRLHGIDAPESSQTYKDADGRTYRCGQRAAFVLADRIGASVERWITVDPEIVTGDGQWAQHSSVSPSCASGVAERGDVVAEGAGRKDVTKI
jgi:hypothetical protein